MPLFVFYREGILNGAPEIKEEAATGLGELIELTSVAALKPSVVNITGPLIRILGDRYIWNVRVAILRTVVILLEKVAYGFLFIDIQLRFSMIVLLVYEDK